MRDTSVLSILRDGLVGLAALVVKANARVEVVGSQLDESSGSAWLYADCLWVTNNHVINNARGKVTLTNGQRRIVGHVIGRDADTNLAVIRAEDSIETEPLTLSTSPPRLGELCFAIGAPLGEFADTMSMGIVSGLNRRLPYGDGKFIEEVLQTDAAINPGNSGGPLVDINGRVLGVNTAGIDDANSIGFAVPALTVVKIVPELVERGVVARASLGARVEVRKSDSSDDIVVRETMDKETALQTGDVLRAIDGRQIMSRADLMKVLGREVIHREIPVVIEHGGKNQTIFVTPKPRT